MDALDPVNPMNTERQRLLDMMRRRSLKRLVRADDMARFRPGAFDYRRLPGTNVAVNGVNAMRNSPLIPNANFVEPTYGAMMDAELMSLPANEASHRRDMKRFRGLRGEHLPVQLLMAHREERAAPLVHYEDELNGLTEASREIKRMAAAGSTYARTGFVRNAANMQLSESTYSHAVYPHDAAYQVGNLYKRFGQTVAETERMRDYRLDYRFWKRFLEDDVLAAIRPIDVQAPDIELSRRGPRGFDTSKGHRRYESKGRVYYVLGRIPENAASYDKHIRRIYRADGVRGRPEFWEFNLPLEEVPSNSPIYISPGQFYAGEEAPLDAKAASNALGEIPAGAKMIRARGGAFAGDTMSTPDYRELGIPGEVGVSLHRLQLQEHYVIYHSAEGHLYGGPGRPLSYHAHYGHRIPAGSYLIRVVFNKASGHRQVRDSILSFATGPLREDELLPPYVQTTKRLRRSAIEALPLESLASTFDPLQQMLNENAVNRSYAPNDRNFLNALRVNLGLPGNLPAQEVAKRALVKMHPNRAGPSTNSEAVNRLIRIRKEREERLLD